VMHYASRESRVVFVSHAAFVGAGIVICDADST